MKRTTEHNKDDDENKRDEAEGENRNNESHTKDDDENPSPRQILPGSGVDPETGAIAMPTGQGDEQREPEDKDEKPKSADERLDALEAQINVWRPRLAALLGE
jgi:hypothetical protein